MGWTFAPFDDDPYHGGDILDGDDDLIAACTSNHEAGYVMAAAPDLLAACNRAYDTLYHISQAFRTTAGTILLTEAGYGEAMEALEKAREKANGDN